LGLSDLFQRRTDKQKVGDAGEDQALRHLQLQGLTLAERNFRCKGGEIDLVMQEGSMLVFVEVRKRKASEPAARFGGAAASIGRAKQRRLVVAAEVYLKRFRMPPACRFDVVAIDGGELSWLKNAFDA
jgi:putative endonuclease